MGVQNLVGLSLYSAKDQLAFSSLIIIIIIIMLCNTVHIIYIVKSLQDGVGTSPGATKIVKRKKKIDLKFSLKKSNLHFVKRKNLPTFILEITETEVVDQPPRNHRVCDEKIRVLVTDSWARAAFSWRCHSSPFIKKVIHAG